MTSNSSRNRAKTRGVRAAMQATGDNYTRAAAKLIGRTSRDGRQPRTDLVLDHIISVLAQKNRENGKLACKIDELQASGKRIINGGQTSGASWEIHDWETSKPLASGDGGPDGYDAMVEKLDPDDTWFHIDAVHDLGGLEPDVVTPGLPPSLCDALAEWARSTPDEEIAEFIGMQLEEIRGLR